LRQSVLNHLQATVIIPGIHIQGTITLLQKDAQAVHAAVVQAVTKKFLCT
jgi:hypothetical protein